MKHVDELIFEAITADETLMAITGGRVISTCFEIPPTDEDNTPVPNIIITDDGFQNQTTTKDFVWEASEDQIQATVDIAAGSPGEVKQLVKLVRKAIETYMTGLYSQGIDIPVLQPGSPSSQGIDWDWTKPCYYQKITYQCVTKADTDDEQEDN